MTFNLETLIRANVATLKPYTPILPFEVLSTQLGLSPYHIIKLDANENPYGASPLVAQRLAEAPYLHIYPDPESRELRAALADYVGVEADYLMVGHGADELIDLIMRVVINPGDAIINCPPTFGMYSFDGEVNGAEVIDVQRRADFSIDVAAIKQAYTDHAPKLIFVTSPNNPDGSLLADDDLKQLLELPALVVLDEAYVEFQGATRIQWVRNYPNLIILRTFSKWAGLAGLRVGYGAFPLDLMAHLWKLKQPYNVNVAGQIAALASLEDRAYLLQNVAKLIEQREQTFQQLQQIEWLQPYPSQANFILCRVIGKNAAALKNQLAKQGILVRYYNSHGLTDTIRLSIGRPEQMARLMGALREL